MAHPISKNRELITKGESVIMVVARNLEKWKGIIEEWENSGLSKHTFCKEKNIESSTFYKWKNKIDLSFRKESYMKAFEEWKSIIEDWEKSGMTKNAYCKERNIEYFAFYAWEKKVRPVLSEQQVELLKKWEEVIADWQESELSIFEYCSEKNINQYTFYKWKNRISPTLQKECYMRAFKKWEPIIEDWKKSGLNINTYCKEKKLPQTTFYAWEKKLNPLHKSSQIKVLEKWEPVIENWKRSGLSRHAYCVQNELTGSLYRWEKRVNPAAIRKSSHMIAFEKWTKIIEDWKESGLNKFVYCKKKGLTNSCFYKWEKKLNSSRSSESPSVLVKTAPTNLEDYLMPFASRSIISGEDSFIKPKIEVKFSQGHRLCLEGDFEWKDIAFWLTSFLKK